MEQFFDVLSGCPLFEGIERGDIPSVLRCLEGRIVDYSKGEMIFMEGDPAEFIAVVLSGEVQIVRDDYYGRRSIITQVQPGEMFAEAFSCAGLETLPVSAAALGTSSILFLSCDKILESCSSACSFHSRLVHNLLREVAGKNLELTRKIRYMSKRTTQEKLMEFLLDQVKRHGKREFVIAYDRQGLADYLGVERSAMSAELGKMRRAGLIESRGSWFKVLAKQP